MNVLEGHECILKIYTKINKKIEFFMINLYLTKVNIEEKRYFFQSNGKSDSLEEVQIIDVSK